MKPFGATAQEFLSCYTSRQLSEHLAKIEAAQARFAEGTKERTEGDARKKMFIEELRRRLAHKFACLVKLELTPAQVAEVRRRNAKYPPGICATHDFCDANVLMDYAFREIYGRGALESEDGSEQQESDCADWSAAWEIAKRDYLTETEKAKASE